MAGGKAFLIKVPLAKEFHKYICIVNITTNLVYFVVTDSVIYSVIQ